MMAVKRLNHAVLYVRDAELTARFYIDVLGFEIAEQMQGAYFLRATGSDNHHDIGLFSIGPNSIRPTSGTHVGLYHLAWEVTDIQDLVGIRETLIARGVFVGESDHGASISLYAEDPDGNEFEVFWPVPKEEWGDRGFGTKRLNLGEEIAKRRAPHSKLT
jgi:catechol-2,3-dioxygenase